MYENKEQDNGEEQFEGEEQYEQEGDEAAELAEMMNG